MRRGLWAWAWAWIYLRRQFRGMGRFLLYVLLLCGVLLGAWVLAWVLDVGFGG